jgi:hypothetical protein
MSCKVKGSTAPGYWGPSISARVQAENIPGKILALLWDKLLALGKDVYLWTQIRDTTPGSIICSCTKDTTKRPDITCSSCYGTGFIPGYVKFLYKTFYFPSVDPGVVLTNVELDTNIKPYRLRLVAGQLTGTIEFPVASYSNLRDLDWEVKNDAANIKSTNSILAEFSTNGTLYYPISEINDTGKKPLGSGSLYVRITLTRALIDDRSPEFEIIRFRYPTSEKPYIKILRPQVTEVPSWMQYGLRAEQLAERYWTVPLNMFDDTIQPNKPEARILENSIYQRVTGINSENKYVTTKLSYNEEFGIFTQQSFDTRVSQPEEVYGKLVF